MSGLVRRTYQFGHFFLQKGVLLDIPEGPIRLDCNPIVYGAAVTNLQQHREWYSPRWHDDTLIIIPSEERALEVIEHLRSGYGERFDHSGTRPVYCSHGLVQYETSIEARLSLTEDVQIQTDIAAFLDCDKIFIERIVWKL